MGTSRTPGELARKIKNLPAAVERGTHEVVAQNAVTAKRNAEQEVKAATKGSSRLSNAGALVRVGESRQVVGRKGADLKVITKRQGPARTLVSAVGPWQLIESPTKQHFIGPAGFRRTAAGSRSGRSSASARQGRAKALRTPYGIKRWVYVRGTRGKRPWGRAFLKTQRDVAQPSKRIMSNAVKRAL